MTTLPGYSLSETLYEGTRTLVYRAIRQADGQPVILKFLRNLYPSFSELVQFRNQYTIAQNLNGLGIVKPLALEPYGNGYVLVMPDEGYISLGQWVKSQAEVSLEECLILALQLAEILHGLAQNRVIHKDIKPANILIHPDSKQVQLIDFSIASLLPKETEEVKHPNVLEGTLAYLAPEQTGRMNRGIDYRSDFYALGVTLFEVLTGKLPFQAEDPMELVHCHIAKTPPELGNREQGIGNREEIPQAISDIVMKLMAKNAEDRYQSALGLKHDLETCLFQLKETGKIEDFEIGTRDLSDRFIIPEKLYGREEEVKILLEAFERVSNGTSELMLVAGFSGIGKTAVVNEVHKPIAQQRGYFIKGKFDQFNRNIPFSAFVQAFRDLMGQLLGESDAQLSSWKAKILKALGENTQVILEVIPELERITGQQPPVPELSGSAAQNRFNLLFQKFIEVFTTKEHPLVMFLDDLQWADLASLNLLKLLMSEANTRYLLILGAYRDNEVFHVHPLMLTLGEIEKSKSIIHTITLAPLSEVTVNRLVADTLSCLPELAQPLTQLTYRKTRGNPFFTTQFLKALHEDGWIEFQPELGYWQCDMTSVRQLALTDDVVEFMALQLQKLPKETQKALKLAACIGNQFELETLAIVSEKSPIATATNLWQALKEGLIIPIDESYKFFQFDDLDENERCDEIVVAYKFLHDRIQQAAYWLIPEAEREIVHYQIGQLLLQRMSPSERQEHIFELVNQLNYGISFLSDRTEQNTLIQLNLLAGLKARSATAYQAACTYAQIGIDLLGEEGWHCHYEQTLALHELAAEVACLSGKFEQMEQWIEAVLANTKMPLEQAKVYQIRIQAFTSQNKFSAAIATGRLALQQFDIYLPEQPTPDYIQQEFQAVLALIGDRPIETLFDLPKMQDANQIAILSIAMSITPVCYMSNSPLLPLIIALQVMRSVEFGNAPSSCFSYSAYGFLLIMLAQAIDLADRFGQLAYRLAQEPEAKNFCSSSLIPLGLFIHHRKSHLQETLPMFQVGYQVGIETGALEDAGYNAQNFCWNSFWCGQSLSDLETQIRSYRQQLLDLNQLATAGYCAIYWATVLMLLERPDALALLNEHDELVDRKKAANDVFWVYQYYLHRCWIGFILGHITQAKQEAVQSRTYLSAAMGTQGEVAFYFYDSLILFANLSTNLSQRDLQFQQVQENQAQLQNWAHHAPMNYLHKWQLVEAEYLRATDNKIEAIDLYDRAISGAKENGYIQEEALANELAAKFYLDWGKEKVAAGYMQEAYYCYAKWGAKAKTDDLEKRYPQLLQPILQQAAQPLSVLETLASIAAPAYSIHSTRSHSSSSTSLNNTLDFAALLKVSQAISSTIQLDELIQSLTQTMLENSGADRCVLMLCQNEQWQVRAISDLQQTTLETVPIEDHLTLPVQLINYVKNTLEAIVLDNLKTELPVAIDPYLQQHQPKSALCLPILDRGSLTGILYLENRATRGVFTSDRLIILNFLASQAAISLENARLYRQVQQTLEELQQAQLQLVQSEKMSALGNLVAGVAHEINNPIGCIVGNVDAAQDYINDLLGIIDLYSENLPNPGVEIEEELEAIDLEYVREDLPKLIKAMKDGGDRITAISKSLRTFSRADSDTKQPFNLHEGIDSTVLILRHRLKANENRPAIEVVTDYGNLPEIACFPGQLNQVFMNILANAIDALDESNSGRSFADIEANPNRINIRTTVEGKQVKIAIADNGKGMSEEVKVKIFDHLFTTKGIGKGTGLGLAIARQIVEDKHGGAIEVNSELGRGTEFSIHLPST